MLGFTRRFCSECIIILQMYLYTDIYIKREETRREKSLKPSPSTRSVMQRWNSSRSIPAGAWGPRSFSSCFSFLILILILIQSLNSLSTTRQTTYYLYWFYFWWFASIQIHIHIQVILESLVLGLVSCLLFSTALLRIGGFGLIWRPIEPLWRTSPSPRPRRKSAHHQVFHHLSFVLFLFVVPVVVVVILLLLILVSLIPISLYICSTFLRLWHSHLVCPSWSRNPFKRAGHR